jgi:chorismate mutase
MAPSLPPYRGPQAERAQIDVIDRELIALLKKRKTLADVIATSPVGSGAMERFLAFMDDRRSWAREHGLDSGYIDLVFTAIAQDYFAKRLERADENPRIFRSE